MRTHRLLAAAILSAICVLNAHAADTDVSQIVYTDKADYPPGSTALIAGSGFTANSTVTLQVTHLDNPLDTDADHFPWIVPTDANGNFTSSWYVNPADSLGSSFRLTADGAGGLHAEWDFTDGNAYTYVPAKKIVLTIPAGGSGQFDQTVTSPSAATASLFLAGNPNFQSWLSTNPTQLDFSKGLTQTWTITVNVPAGTPGNTYFLGRVKVSGDGGLGSGTGVWVNVTAATNVLSVIVNDETRTYGAPDAFTGTVAGVLPGDNITVTYAYASNIPAYGPSTPVGDYDHAIVPVFNDPDGKLQNYTLSIVDATLHVTPATLTVTVDNQTCVYGSDIPPLTGSISGIQNNENITATYSTTAKPGSPVGHYDIIATLSGISANYVVEGGPGLLTITPAPLTVKADSISIVFGTPIPVLTGTITGIKNGDNITATYGTTAVNFSSVNSYDITPSLVDPDSKLTNYDVTIIEGTLTITPVLTQSNVTVTPNCQQYSDLVTFTATLSPDSAGGVSPADHVTFKVGTQVIGTVPLTSAAGVLTGKLTSALLEPTPFGTAPTGQMAPGDHTVTAVFTTINTNFTVGSPTTSLKITQEDARATYTGSVFVSTGSPAKSTAIVTLSATIQDISVVDPSDPNPGDIRNATVTFINRDTNTVIKSGLPVGLVSLSDAKTGTVTYNWNVDIGSANSATFTVGIIVCNYYTRNSSGDNTVITVSKAVGTGFITGGGYLVLTNSSGLFAGGAGTKNNFGFNVKYNKGGTNLQGNLNTIVRNNGHVYQIKSNSITSLVTTTTVVGGMATFDAKANIQDITDSANPIAVDGNASLHVTMTDNGEPGVADTIGITVWNKSGGLWYSSNWTGIKTADQLLGSGKGGGNLQVH
jgi:hypothetical protein